MRWRMEGDASTRIFERLTRDGQTSILMNAPRRPDGPPVRDGKPYSAIAHLAEDIVPYVAIASGLRDRNLSAPAILDADLERGLLIMEDLGNERIVSGDPPAPIEARYEAAVEVLVSLHRRRLPETLPVAPQRDYRIPRYDMEAFLIEAELLLDWYLVSVDAAPADGVRESFTALWRDALEPAVSAAPTWVLRDYHSPNLMWLPDREDVARIGILDFQDMLIGPGAYDVASLLQDARVDVSEELELALLSHYARARLHRRALRPGGVRAALRNDGGAAGDQDSRHLCPAQPAGWQAAIFASYPPPIGLSAAVAGASRARAASGLVCRERAVVEWAMMDRIGRC